MDSLQPVHALLPYAQTALIALECLAYHERQGEAGTGRIATSGPSCRQLAAVQAIHPGALVYFDQVDP